ncbi:MAG: Aspartyl/glutamyl-tRNA(Asn/Gln) amidotransferase subunit B [Candidatus Gallionella acididurans]|uniref:Aspartyl/glutamyl-tRNA(Asn/Gln) amidotransferase subunit B n=1 Tax=Candidatus Gallionella acididurans TaxID=1796491 RepID=A0A139BSY5_9PROT|nr:MAG: Aspartyl/glutamyl-tRNA(Asn/Gln) amidotransferase subunit B [Candidatus Gallionella acididurans]
MQWEIVIGLEVHTQLSTNTKIFSGASTTYGAEPNTQADAVSIALPGVLPVLNKGAVELAIKFGLAVGAHIAPRSVFARKNYFYPDLPKGYQISQFDQPVVGQGALTIQVEPLSGNAKPYEKVVRITRAHLEEDAGKSIHKGFDGVPLDTDGFDSENDNLTRLDFNRAGTPLLEIVSEPDMHSAAEAVAYAKKLHELVCWYEICDGNMQEGSFRCDVNVSVRRPGEPLGTRREIKNLNSFLFMQQAIDYEVQWQIDTLENGGKIQQATVLFNPDTGETRAMRSKEEAHDYRYFPDPDLLPLVISPEWIDAIKSEMSKSPEQMHQRLVVQYLMSPHDASVLVSNRKLTQFFLETSDFLLADPELIEKKLVQVIPYDERTLSADYIQREIATATIQLETNQIFKQCFNWLTGEMSAQMNRDGLDLSNCPITPQQLGGLLKCIADGTISNSGAKEVFRIMWEYMPQIIAGQLTITLLNGKTIVFESAEKFEPTAIIEKLGLKQLSDTGAIEKIVDEIITANPAQVAEYRSGKEKVFGFFVGLAMKASKGKANPAQLNDVLKKKLSG